MGKEAKLMPNYCYKCPECGELKSTLTEIKELLQLSKRFTNNKEIYFQLITDILGVD